VLRYTQRARNLLSISQKDNDEYFTEEFGYGHIDQKKMFDSRDLVLPSINITEPINESTISGLQNIEADISGEYALVTVTSSGVRDSDNIPVTTFCIDSTLETCEIDTGVLVDGQEYVFEVRLSDDSGNVIARDSIVALIDNLALILSDEKTIYSSSDVLPLYYSVSINNQDVAYRVAIDPIQPSGDRIILLEETSKESVSGFIEVVMSDLSSSGKYMLVLEADFLDEEGQIHTATESKYIYVDFGLKDNFPVKHESSKSVNSIRPIQILDLDDSDESKEIYSSKIDCSSGWCYYNGSELWQVNSNGELKDMMTDFGFDNSGDNWHHVIGTSSRDENNLNLKVYNIFEEYNDFEIKPGSVANISSKPDMNWKKEIETGFDYIGNDNLILSQDMDSNGTVETVVAREVVQDEDQVLKIYIFDEQGEEALSFIASSEQDSRRTHNMIIGNFDEDFNTKEILITSIVPDCSSGSCWFYPPKEYQMNAFDIQGNHLWSQSILSTDGNYNSLLEDGPYSVDVDGDAIDEIVALRFKYDPYDRYNADNRWILVDVYSNSGELIDSYETPSSQSYDRTQKIAFADINSDGKIDALVTNGIYYTAITLDTGEKIFEKEISEPVNGNYHITIDHAMIADFNNDGNQEVMFITGTRWGTYYGEPIPKTMRLFDAGGDEIINDNFPKVYPMVRSNIGDELDYSDMLAYFYPQITDFDNDGIIDIVFQTTEDYSYNNTYYVTELGGDASTIQADGSFMLNQARTGHYEPFVPVIDTPTHFSAIPQDKSALISWNKDQLIMEDIVGYNIYQSLSPDSFIGEPINKKLIEELEYEVKKLDNNTTYYFAITALDEDSNESELSDPIIITPYEGPYMQFDEEVEIGSVEMFRGSSISGDKFVWTEYFYDSATSDIYMYNTKTGEKSTVASGLEHVTNHIDIDGDIIVWPKSFYGGISINAYNLATQEQFAISDNEHDIYDSAPQVFGNYVVWRSNKGIENGSVSEIWLHDLETGISEKISHNLYNPNNPQIYGNKVIYTSTSPSSVTDMYLYDIDTKEQTEIISGIEGGLDLDFYGSYIIWASEFEGEQRIRLYNLKTQEIKNIGITNGVQRFPSIHNNKITWVDERDGSYANLYIYDLGTNNEYQVTSVSMSENSPVVFGDTIVWSRYNDGMNHFYMKKAYTIPNSPINLTSEGDKENPKFEINWENPFDPSGIKWAWYKLGEAPESNEDGTYTTEQPFIATATEKNQKLYVWLENNDGYKDYEKAEKVVIKYNPSYSAPDPDPILNPKPSPAPAPAPTPIILPPSSGGGGGGNSTPPMLKNIQKFLKTKDGTNISSEESKVTDNGKIVEELVESNIKLSENPTDIQTIRLDTSNTAVAKEIILKLSENTLKEFASVFGTEKDFKVTVTSKEAEQKQKTEHARQELYLEGFDVFSIDISTGTDIIDSFANPAELTFDISDVDFDKDNLKVYYFNEKNGTWARAGSGGKIDGNKLTVSINHLTDFGIMRETSKDEIAEYNNIAVVDDQWQKIENGAQMIALSGSTPEKLDALILYTGNSKSLDQQIHWTNTFSAPMSDQSGLGTQQMYAINNFIVYGTTSTQGLGAGERAGVISSYQRAYNRLPVTVDDWRDCIAIAAGRWPSEKSQSAESQAEESFRTIYKRAPSMDNANDNAAVTVMAYGLRSSNRNLDSEKSTIKLFKRIFSHNPLNALDWNIVRAITYSGASR